MPSLAGLSKAELAEKLIAIGVEPKKTKMRVEQLWRWIYHYGVTDFAAMTNVAKELRATLAEHYTLARPEIVTQQTSTDGTRKWLIRLGRGRRRRGRGRVRRRRLGQVGSCHQRRTSSSRV
jgi:23S rRNA (adenine2503-C2)-methyltransferase